MSGVDWDELEAMSAEEFLAFAPRPGTPSSAATLLDTTIDLHLLDARDWDLATLQPHPFEWCEE